ncbi:MAG: MFS transporter [Promethearchaeota archaeon]|nr:MAG: MFS transporter [Candidatus Lokiarchaeota archaeon]
MEKTTNNEEFSKLNCSSYGLGAFLQQFLRMALTSLGFYFYEEVLELEPLLTMTGYIIFCLWNAFNDPLIGFFVNRPFRFTKKWGRFFPWIMIAGIPWLFCYILIYSPPFSDKLTLFIWLIFTTCLFDTFNSLFFVNFQALFPTKYQTNKIRRTASAIVTMLGTVGIAFGAIIPPLFVRKYETPALFIIQSIVVSIIGGIVFILGISGWREKQSTIDDYLETYEEKKEKSSYSKSFKSALKIRSFFAFLILYGFWQVVTYCIQTSVPYVVDQILQKGSIYQTLLQAAFLIGGLLSIPVWMKYSHKQNNNKKVMLLGSSFLAIMSITLTFFPNVILLFIQIAIWGIGLGGVWIMLKPIMADIIDQSVINTEIREEGVYYGIYQFFSRTGWLMQAIIFGVIHMLTGFAEDPSSPSAQLGIRLHFGLVPTLFLIVGIIIFWKYYTLTPEKVRENQEILKGLGI